MVKAMTACVRCAHAWNAGARATCPRCWQKGYVKSIWTIERECAREQELKFLRSEREREERQALALAMLKGIEYPKGWGVSRSESEGKPETKFAKRIKAKNAKRAGIVRDREAAERQELADRRARLDERWDIEVARVRALARVGQ